MSVLAAATAGPRRFLDFLLVALIVVVLIGILLGKLVPLTGRQTMIVGGASMEPAIGLGAAIVIRQVEPADLQIGDVVSLRAGEKQAIYTHRIVSIVDRPDGRYVGTQGDANPEPDPTITPASSIIGRSEFVIPFAGYLLQIMSLPVGVLFLVGLAATLLAAAWLLETLQLEQAVEGGTTSRPAAERSGRGPVAIDASLAGFRRRATEQLADVRAARLRRAPRRLR